MKKISSLFFALCAAALVTAKDEIVSGTVYDNDENAITWSYNTENKVLSFTGNGAIPDNEMHESPWDAYRLEVKQVELSQTIKGIGNYAFHGFEGLTAMTLPDQLTSIGQYAFWECINLHDFQMGEVTDIGQWAFSGCVSLTILTIPNSAQTIRHNAFSFVPNIRYLDSRTDDYDARTVNGYVENDFVYTNQSKKRLSACSAVHRDTVEVDPAVELVETDAFRNCIHLKSVIFGDNVEKLEEYVFFGCANMESVTLGAGTKELLNYSLQCPKLKMVHCKAVDVPEAKTNAFYEVKKNEATLYVPKESLDAYRDADVWRDFGTILPEESAAIDEIRREPSGHNKKVIKEGQVLIQKGNRTYTITGQEVR